MQDKSLSDDHFSSGLFWDIDPTSLDMQQHMSYIVSRVLEVGTLADWNLLCKHLSLPGVIKVAQTLRTLDRKSLAFLSVVGRIPQEQFRCCTQKQSTQTHWIS